MLQKELRMVEPGIWVGVINEPTFHPAATNSVSFGLIKSFTYEVKSGEYLGRGISGKFGKVSYAGPKMTYDFRRDEIRPLANSITTHLKNIFIRQNLFEPAVKKIASEETSNLRRFLEFSRILYEEPELERLPL